MVNLAVAGAAGRMGRALIEASQLNSAVRLAYAIDRASSDVIGLDAGELAGLRRLETPIRDSLAGAEFDVLIEFTNPGATLEHAAWCAAHGRRMVIGTTGIDDADRERLRDTAEKIPVVLAPNMSVGVNLCIGLIEIAAQTLGDSVDIEVLEAHHRYKVDAPSGTALAMGEAAARALGRSLDRDGVFSRHGHTGARERRHIGFSVVRAGDIIGEHTLLFVGDGERVEITHKATSRMTFASGAVRAAIWLMDQPAGLYDMQDVLGLR